MPSSYTRARRFIYMNAAKFINSPQKLRGENLHQGHVGSHMEEGPFDPLGYGVRLLPLPPIATPPILASIHTDMVCCLLCSGFFHLFLQENLRLILFGPKDDPLTVPHRCHPHLSSPCGSWRFTETLPGIRALFPLLKLQCRRRRERKAIRW